MTEHDDPASGRGCGDEDAASLRRLDAQLDPIDQVDDMLLDLTPGERELLRYDLRASRGKSAIVGGFFLLALWPLLALMLSGLGADVPSSTAIRVLVGVAAVSGVLAMLGGAWVWSTSTGMTNYALRRQEHDRRTGER